MAYQLYRNTTIGNTLQETLDNLIKTKQITPELKEKVLLQFDKSINLALSQKTDSRITFKVDQLSHYRFCNNVWIVYLNNVEFRENGKMVAADKVKIVACDGKRSFRPCGAFQKF